MIKIKTLIITFFLCLISIFAQSQCNCDKIHRADGTTITQCNALPVAYDNTTQIGLAAASNGQANFITMTVRFKNSSQNISGNLNLRLVDNNLITLKLVNAQLAYIGNSQVAQAVFCINAIDIIKLKKSGIKVIMFKFKDELLHTYKASSNINVLKNQLNCL